MAEMKDIVKVAVDAYHGNVEQYSVGQSMELLHKALIDANALPLTIRISATASAAVCLR